MGPRGSRDAVDTCTGGGEQRHLILFITIGVLLLLWRVLTGWNAPWPSVCQLVFVDTAALLSVLLFVSFVLKLMEDARVAEREKQEREQAARLADREQEEATRLANREQEEATREADFKREEATRAANFEREQAAQASQQEANLAMVGKVLSVVSQILLHAIAAFAFGRLGGGAVPPLKPK